MSVNDQVAIIVRLIRDYSVDCDKTVGDWRHIIDKIEQLAVDCQQAKDAQLRGEAKLLQLYQTMHESLALPRPAEAWSGIMPAPTAEKTE